MTNNSDNDINQLIDITNQELPNMDDDTMNNVLDTIRQYVEEVRNTISLVNDKRQLKLLQNDNIPSSIELQLVVQGLTSPVALTCAKDKSGRLFIVDQIGVVKILTADGRLLEQPFLDLRDKIVQLSPQYDERGLLSLAFHPDYANNGRFFVFYTAEMSPESIVFYDNRDNFNHANIISEFKVSDDPNIADKNSERIILNIGNPAMNHNGGHITFGPDRYLYIPLGDGGGANDTGFGHMPGGNAQHLNTLLGKILRINIDNNNNGPYGIPSDNPFINVEGLPEIYAYGLRNPYHIAFDSGGSRQLFAMDAGQNLWEEVNIIEKGGNYGWNIREGTHCFDPDNPMQSPASCPDTGANGEPFIDPIIEFPNANQPNGLAVTVIGGYIYRGRNIAELDGTYVFGGYSRSMNQSDGSIFVAIPPTQPNETMWSMKELSISNHPNGRIGSYILSFAEDKHRELYVLTRDVGGITGGTGKVYRLIRSPII